MLQSCSQVPTTWTHGPSQSAEWRKCEGLSAATTKINIDSQDDRIWQVTRQRCWRCIFHTKYHKISQNKVLKKYPCKTCGTLIDVNNPNRRCDTTWYDLLYLLSWSPRHGPICTLLRTVLGSKDACATSKQKPSKTSHLASMSYERYKNLELHGFVECMEW